MKKYTLILFLCFLLKAGFSQPIITQQPVSKTVCENGDVQITIAATGTGLTYQWQLNYMLWYDINPTNVAMLKSFLKDLEKMSISGGNTNTLTIQNVSFAMNAKPLRCVVKDASNGSVTSTEVTLTIRPLPTVDKNSVLRACEPNLISINLNSIIYSSTELAACKYELTRGTVFSSIIDDSNPMTVPNKFSNNPDSTGKYILTTTNRVDNTCFRKDTLDIAVQRVYNKEQIGLVTFDSKSKKYKLVMNITPGMGTDSCRIYSVPVALALKGAIAAGQISLTELTTTVSASFSGVYTDNKIDPMKGTGKFAIQIRDTCGHISGFSSIHVPIHTSPVIDSMKNTLTLKWNDYEGFNYGKFYIHRYSKIDSLHLRTHIIDSISNTADSVHSWIDNNPVPNSYYAISVNLPKIYTLKSLLKSESGPYTQSLSNIVEYQVTPSSAISVENFPAIVYPNPFSNILNLDISLNESAEIRVEILNLLGQKELDFALGILNAGIQSKQISTDQLKEGIYFIKISGANKTAIFKAICKK